MPRAPTSRQSEEDLKPQKIPRPPNAWILYRTDSLREWRSSRSPNDPPMKQADISRFIASKWKHEPDDIKLEYEKRAAIAKSEHKKKYPDYKYNPISKEAKDRMRAEEREAKKKAREEAKAAKMAGRRISGGARAASNSSHPSGSNVKLEAFDEVKSLPAPETINRGCGPSPPIDYDPESCSTSSTPLPSSSSSASHSSPFISSSSSSYLPPTPLDAQNAWLHRVSSPASSPPSQPPPAYPSNFIHSPMPSRHTSSNFSPAFPPTSASTPSESPPSYTEGEGWQPQPPDSGYQSFVPLPEFQSDWNAFAQYRPLLQPDIAFPAPAIDPLLALSDGEQVSFDAASAGAIFDLSAAQPTSVHSPPGELEIQQLLSQIAAVNETFNPGDQLAPMLDMPELHETVEDDADDTGLPAPTDAQPWTLEDFAAWVNAHPHSAMNLADPNFYFNMGLELVSAYPHLAANMQPPPFSAEPNGMPVPAELTPVQDVAIDPATYQMFGFDIQHQQQQEQQRPELAMPAPMVPTAVPTMSTVSTPVQPEVVARTPGYTHSQQATSEGAPAPAPRRYVPPSGAGMPARRRVAGKFQPRKSDFEDGSA